MEVTFICVGVDASNRKEIKRIPIVMAREGVNVKMIDLSFIPGETSSTLSFSVFVQITLALTLVIKLG